MSEVRRIDCTVRQWTWTCLRRAWVDGLLVATGTGTLRSTRRALKRGLYFALAPAVIAGVYAFIRPESWPETKSALVFALWWLVACVIWFMWHFGNSLIAVVRRRSSEDFLCLEACGLLVHAQSLREAFAEITLSSAADVSTRMPEAMEGYRDFSARLEALRIAHPKLKDLMDGDAYAVHLHYPSPSPLGTSEMSTMNMWSGRLSRALLLLLAEGKPIATVMQGNPRHHMFVYLPKLKDPKELLEKP